jgi:hypothetical protein
MVVEFPLTGCIANSASKLNRARMTSANAQLLDACARLTPTSDMKQIRGTATITRVEFFDTRGHASDSALNGIELHPVTAFSSATCRRFR